MVEHGKRFSMIKTFKGKDVDVFNFTKNSYDPDDVAHALARICRYNGHSSYFYSVALHSVNTYKIAQVLKANEPTKFYALIHDATEAYIGDMPGPIKKKMPEFQKLESGIQAGINEYYNEIFKVKDWTIDVDMNMVHKIDRSLLIPEMAAMFKNTVMEFDLGPIYSIPSGKISLTSGSLAEDTSSFMQYHSSGVSAVIRHYTDKVPQVPQVDI